MNTIAASSSSVPKTTMHSQKTFAIQVDAAIELDTIFACIHTIGEGKDGIITKQIIQCSKGALSLTFNTADIHEKNAFQIYGFIRSSSGEKKPVVALFGKSTQLFSTSILKLENFTQRQ